MAAFEYEAVDMAGKPRRGVVSADSARLARQELKRRKLFPTRLTAAARKGQAKSRFNIELGAAIGQKDLTLLTRQLATLVTAAAPLEEALHMMAMQAEKPRIRDTLLAIRSRVTEGYRFSEALAAEPRSFGSLYRSMTAAGEVSGSLGPVLERLADHLEKAQRLRAKITTALAYPIFLSLVAVGVISALMTFVVPKVVDQFTDMGQELPGITLVMIGISHFMRGFGPLLLLGLVAGGLTFARALRRDGFRRKVDTALLRLPILGRLMGNLQTARFARTLSTLIASGCSVVESLRAAEQILHNRVFREAVADISTQVVEGASLSAALKRSRAFPPMIAYMAASGENSGKLDEMMGKCADYLEREFEDFTAAALSLLEPAIIILMGGVVATIVLSILMPILKLNTLAMT